MQFLKYCFIFNYFDVEKNCLLNILQIRKKIEFLEEIIVLKPLEREMLNLVRKSYIINYFIYHEFIKLLSLDKKLPINLPEFLSIFLYNGIFAKYFEQGLFLE